MTDELIARLEKATGPDRELDAKIYRIVADPRWEPDIAEDRKVYYCVLMARAYTASIDAALTLVPEGYYWSMDSRGCAVVCAAEPPSADVSWVRGHTTPAIALCIAALKARSAQSS